MKIEYYTERIPLNIIDSKQLCLNCLYDHKHPFGITFSSDSICSGCITHTEKDKIDWLKRKELFDLLIASILKGRKRAYDCVIPTVGDAEDYYVVKKVLENNLNPLIVCVNDYFMNDIGWHNLHNLITHFDLDSIVYNPNIVTYKELVRTTLRKMDHMLWPAIALRSSFPAHIALQRKIPLIIWGQNQPLEQVGKYSHMDSVEMSKWSRVEHDLFGFDVDAVVGSGAQVDIQNLNYYRYPLVKGLGEGKVKGLYLSNYFRWDPLSQNQQSLSQGYRTQSQTATFDIYERAGSSVYYGIHDILKFKRCGYRKIRDQLCREIRHGRVSREEALSIESLYTSSKVDISGFFKWLGVTKSGLDWFIEKRLKDVNGFITTTGFNEPKINIPSKIQELLVDSNGPERNFVEYGKGIYL